MLQQYDTTTQEAMPMGGRDPLLEHQTREEATSNELTIESRYGTVTVSLENAIYFPHGLLGLPDFKDFCLTEMPNPKLGQFKLLQSLNDSELSFVVLPFDPKDSDLIEDKDVQECLKVTGVREEHMVMLLIVAVQRTPAEVKITANLRAPVVIDAEGKAAIQYVFSNTKYNVAHPLN